MPQNPSDPKRGLMRRSAQSRHRSRESPLMRCWDRFVKGNRLAWSPCVLPLSERRFSTRTLVLISSQSVMGGTKRKGDGGGSSNQKAHAATQAPCNPDKKQKVQAQESAGITHYMASFQVLASDVEHNSPSLLLNIDKFGRTQCY